MIKAGMIVAVEIAALERKYGEAELSPLDDTQELTANQYMAERLKGTV